jgi:hypothetical protein
MKVSGEVRASTRRHGAPRSRETNIDRMYTLGTWSTAVLDQARAVFAFESTVVAQA